MGENTTPFDGSAGGTESIFDATYRTLVDDGYAALSISRIADRASVSKSTIYHHFESKDDLLLEFAESLLVRYGDELVLEPEGNGNGLASIRRLLDLTLLGETADGEQLEDIAPDAIHRVYLELRTQAVHDPEYRNHFDAVDRRVRDRLAAVIAVGIEDGCFRDVDPDAVAGTIYLFVEGALFLGSTTDDDRWLRGVRTQLDRYLEGLVRDEFLDDV